MIKEKLEQHIKLEEIQTNIIFVIFLGLLELLMYGEVFIAMIVFFVLSFYDIVKREL